MCEQYRYLSTHACSTCDGEQSFIFAFRALQAANSHTLNWFQSAL